MTDTTDKPMNIVCLYLGRPRECQECGFFDETGTGFCSHECRQARADREARHLAELQTRRAEEDAFGDAVQRQRAAGRTWQEVDAMSYDQIMAAAR